MSDVETTRRAAPERVFPDYVVERSRSRWSRVYYGETAVDFYGTRWRALTVSLLIVVIAFGSLALQQLNLGIDFEGGVAWDVPSDEMSADDVRAVLSENGVDGNTARVQVRTAAGERRVQAEVLDQDPETREIVQQALAQAAGIDTNDVSVKDVSERWGDHITRQAAKALLVFVGLVTIFIAIRFDLRMSVAAIAAMLHDVVVAVGVYSVLQLLVTPATVIAFLTILGFSLYDTLVVFDKIRENREAYAESHLNIADVASVSMNQVLGRALNTTLSSLLPVLSLLVVGAWMFGAVTLREFALALMLGMLAGTYSSIFVAVPLFVMLSGRPRELNDHATGTELRRLVMGAAPFSRRESTRVRKESAQQADKVPERPKTKKTKKKSPASDVQPVGDDAAQSDKTAVEVAEPDDVATAPSSDTSASSGSSKETSPEKLLSHPPRPRKKKKR